MPLKIDKNKDFSYGKENPYRGPLFQMIVSKLTSKSQTTIPQSVRRALDMRPGDILEYEIADGKVILTKALKNNKTDDPFRTFDEWNSEADEHAYGDL